MTGGTRPGEGATPPPEGRTIPPDMSSEELREWRKRLGLSQAKLAKILGMTKRIVQYWESGEQPVPSYVAWICQLVEDVRIAKGLSGWSVEAFARETLGNPPWYLKPEEPKRNETVQGGPPPPRPPEERALIDALADVIHEEREARGATSDHEGTSDHEPENDR